MDYNSTVQFNESYPMWLIIALVVIAILEFVFKGMALYRAARNQSKGWFVVLFILNTAGILPILYLLMSKNPNKD